MTRDQREMWTKRALRASFYLMAIGVALLVHAGIRILFGDSPPVVVASVILGAAAGLASAYGSFQLALAAQRARQRRIRRALLTSLSPEELARAPRLTAAEIEEALNRGRRDAERARRGGGFRPPGRF